MYKGSCLCGEIKYEIKAEPKSVSSCHCTMCQKQHGAAFATYANFEWQYLCYISGEDKLVTYNSSGTTYRRFCRCCGSSLEWSDEVKFPNIVSIAVGTFDSPFEPNEIEDIYTDTKMCWLR